MFIVKIMKSLGVKHIIRAVINGSLLWRDFATAAQLSLNAPDERCFTVLIHFTRLQLRREQHGNGANNVTIPLWKRERTGSAP